MNEEKKIKNKRIRFKKYKNYFLGGTGTTITTPKKTNYILNNAVSLLIYLFPFLTFHFIRKETILLQSNYAILLLFLIISLIVGALLSNKLILTVHHEFWQIYRKLSISLILSLGFLSLALLIVDVPNISRTLLLWTFISGFILESLYYFLISERRKNIKVTESLKISITYLLIDGLLLSFFCYMEVIDSIGPANLKEQHFVMFAVIYLGWIFSGATTHKFQPVIVAKSKWEGLGLHTKFYLLIISLVFLSVYFLQISPTEWDYFIKGTLKYIIVSGLLAFLLFAERIRSKTDEATTLFLKAYELEETPVSFINTEGSRKYGFVDTQDSESVVKHKLQFEYLKEYEDVFSFIERKFDLKSFDIRRTHITRSLDPYNINILPPESQQMIINLHVINDQRKINDYLRDINKRLVKGGVFVGAMLPNKNRYHRYLNNYPFLLANLFFFIDFIWKRAFPKLPITRKIYFMLSKGKDRAISLAEGLGRLIFCGFEILDLTVINDQIYFAVVKVKQTSYETNPYYSPFFKMRRVGEGGKPIFVYKLRTMHPYSELIQNFVYINNKIQEGGKFKNDFRIPGWGKFFRSVWIDELPMILNLLRRDIKLVGVRPISSQYMSLYSPEHQELRKRFKPGLVPPYYADMPKTIEEIEASEAAYFSAYVKHPFLTDVKYFLRVMNNILLKEKRSS